MNELKEKIENAFKIVLRHSGKEYIVWDDLYVFEDQESYGEPLDGARFMWEEGNYSCDCNKSLFIQRQCDPSFPDMHCGESIELVSLDQVTTNSDDVGRVLAT